MQKSGKIDFWVLGSLFVLLASCSSCVQLKKTDISVDTQFERVVGKRVLTNKVIWAIAFTSKSPAGETADSVVLYSKKLARTRFVVSRVPLEPGTVLEILKVLETKNVIVKIIEGRRLEYEVRIVGSNSSGALPTYISSLDIIGSPSDANYGLNPEFYSALPKQ